MSNGEALCLRDYEREAGRDKRRPVGPIPPDAQVQRRTLRRRIRELEAQVAELEALVAVTKDRKKAG